MERRIPLLDALRGAAALCVLAFHAEGFWSRGQVSMWEGGSLAGVAAPQAVAHVLFGWGFVGVSLFFVLSGLCVHLPNAGRRGLELRGFALRRLLRLWPAYFATATVALALHALAGDPRASLGNLAGHAVFWIYDWPPQNNHWATVVLWSVVAEVQLYACYALAYPALARFGFGRSAALALVLGVAYALACDAWGRPALWADPHFFGPARFGEWLVGAWIAERLAARRLAVPRALAPAGAALLAASIAGAIALGASKFALDVPASLACAALVAGLVASPAARWCPAPMRWLGERSYSLYLIHYLVIGTVGEAFARVLRIDKEAAGGSLAWAGVTLAGIAAALVAAEVLYRAIEAPSHRWARRASAPRLRPAAAAPVVADVGRAEPAAPPA